LSTCAMASATFMASSFGLQLIGCLSAWASVDEKVSRTKYLGLPLCTLYHRCKEKQNHLPISAAAVLELTVLNKTDKRALFQISPSFARLFYPYRTYAPPNPPVNQLKTMLR
jgi:hypothetical protein